MLKDGGNFEGDEPDYSELQLAWFGRTAVGDETNPTQAGEGSYAVRTSAGADLTGNDVVLNSGGDFNIAAATLAAWEGAANEADIPYENHDGIQDLYMDPEKIGDWSLDESKRDVSAVHVQDVDIFPGMATFSDPEHPSTEGYVFNEEALKTVKQLLMNEGAVGGFYYADQSWPVDDPDTLTIENTAPNHLITIVGWDDTYEKENFSEDPAKQPSADGAWIVKNSWGNASYGDDW